MPKKISNPDKNFLKKPEYPGGNKALKLFIDKNLQFPKDAILQNIFGTVAVAFEVTDNGEVINAKVVKGLFPSCDEEALRIVRLLKYGKAFNHGVRLKSNHKINIHFNKNTLNTLKISYSITPAKPNPSTDETHHENGYSYSLTIKKSNN